MFLLSYKKFVETKLKYESMKERERNGIIIENKE